MSMKKTSIEIRKGELYANARIEKNEKRSVYLVWKLDESSPLFMEKLHQVAKLSK